MTRTVLYRNTRPWIGLLRICAILVIAASALTLTGCASLKMLGSPDESIMLRVPNNRLSPGIEGVHRLAVLDFDCCANDTGTGVGRNVAGTFISQLSESGHYKIAERAQIERIMEELKNAYTNDMLYPNTEAIWARCDADG